MKWVVIAIAALAATAFGIGKWTDGNGESSEYAIAAATIFYVPGFVLLGIDAVLLIGWGIAHLMFGV